MPPPLPRSTPAQNFSASTAQAERTFARASAAPGAASCASAGSHSMPRATAAPRIEYRIMRTSRLVEPAPLGRLLDLTRHPPAARRRRPRANADLGPPEEAMLGAHAQAGAWAPGSQKK